MFKKHKENLSGVFITLYHVLDAYLADLFSESEPKFKLFSFLTYIVLLITFYVFVHIKVRTVFFGIVAFVVIERTCSWFEIFGAFNFDDPPNSRGFMVLFVIFYIGFYLMINYFARMMGQLIYKLVGLYR